MTARATAPVAGEGEGLLDCSRATVWCYASGASSPILEFPGLVTVRWLTLKLAVLASYCFSLDLWASPPVPVILDPSVGSVQVFVDESPPGTTFVFGSGIYRSVSIQPKSGDTFIGSHGAILNGSELLSWR